MADIGKQLAAAQVGLAQGMQRLAQLGGAGVDLRLELQALQRLAGAVLLQFGRHGVDAARHGRELVVTVQRNAVLQLALAQQQRARTQLIERAAQRAVEVQRGGHRQHRQGAGHRQPEAAHPGQRGVGRRALTGHGVGLAGHAFGDQLPHVAPLRAVEHRRQRLPGLLRIGAWGQRLGGVHRPFQFGHAGAQHAQRVLAPQVLAAGGRAVVERDGLRGQHLQVFQRQPHVTPQPFAHLGLCAGTLLALRHPGAQPLLGGRQLHEGGADVAGNAATRHLAFGHAQRGGGAQAFQHGSGRQQTQRNGQSASKHGGIV